jgi:glucose-6-phosphate-specific signal transduction histidine kinase
MAHDLPDWLTPLVLVAALLSFLLPFLVGVFYPDDNWRWGPLLAMVLSIGALAMMPATGQAEQSAIGLVTKKDMFLFVLFSGGLLFFPLVSLVFCGIASAGIWVGRKRAAQRNWEDNAEFRNMFALDRSTKAHDR